MSDFFHVSRAELWVLLYIDLEYVLTAFETFV